MIALKVIAVLCLLSSISSARIMYGQRPALSFLAAALTAWMLTLIVVMALSTHLSVV